MPNHLPHSQAKEADLIIRSARPCDATQLAALLQQLGHDEPALDSCKLSRHLSQRGNRNVLVAERHNLLLGTCTLHLIEHLAHTFARSAIIEDMVVDVEHRDHGVGRALILEAINQARTWGCYKLALSSATSRQIAHHFYQSQGFEPHGISLALNLKTPT